MNSELKIVYVDWKQWETQTFLTDQNTQIRVGRAAVPIIFVPGIMGSRLKKVGGGRAWDPDDAPFMLHNFYGATGSEHENLLIKPALEVNQKDAGGEPTFSFRERMLNKFTYNSEGNSSAFPPEWDWLDLSQKLPAPVKLGKIISTLIDHGWDELAWNFYGDIMLRLAEGDFSELSRCFIHPVYAFGYNWIDNNLTAGQKLADRIRAIISQEDYANHPCDRVILVSHSMGGLVTRSCILHDNDVKGKVLGIIHGAQPATGAPAAYRRMRAGFEGPDSYWPFENLGAAITNRVMGLDDSRVVPILANCVGGLELLPTVSYKTNAGDTKWLPLSNKENKVVCKLPYENPYSDIYFSESTAAHQLSDDEASFSLCSIPACFLVLATVPKR